jgi:very-short-patch-repair endonuclease
MARIDRQTASRAAWALSKGQHWTIARRQLIALGFTREAIAHRIADGRLYPVWRGVYAVGRRDLSPEGLFMGAVLACGDDAVLSHESATWLWGIRKVRGRVIEVTVPPGRNPRRRGIRAHRRTRVDSTHHNRIPVTSPTQTLLDIAPHSNGTQLERAVNEAVNRDLVDLEELRRELDKLPGCAGVRPLRKLLDRDTFALTDSELEQYFLPIARAAGLPRPQTQAYVNGFRVDFYWPELGLVVEADSLRFHRTPAQQRRDRERDQAHAIAGLTPLRFTHWQIAREPRHVKGVLVAVAAARASTPTGSSDRMSSPPHFIR